MNSKNISVRESVTKHLTDFHQLTRELLQAIAASASSKEKTTSNPSVSELFQQLLQKDRDLQEVVKQLDEHQQFQKKLQDIQKQIEEKDDVIHDLISQLKQAERILQDAVDEGNHRIEVLEKAQTNAVDPVDLVSYAHKISYTTAGPPGWAMGERLVLFHPPAPQEVEIRSGLLYSKVNLPDDIKPKENNTQ